MDNLTKVACNLGGNTLQIGGNGFISYGLIYGIRSASTSMCRVIERIPKIMNPENETVKAYRLGLNKSGLKEVVSEGEAKSLSNYDDVDESLAIVTRNTPKRVGYIGLIIGIGIAFKHFGKWLSSDTTVERVEYILGGKKN